MDKIRTIKDIDESTPEGALLYAAIALINTELKRSKNPDEVLAIIKETAFYINGGNMKSTENLALTFGRATNKK